MGSVDAPASQTPPEGASATLTVTRQSPEDMQERELYVSVDGQRRGILRFGDSLEVPLSAGHHRLRVHNTISRRYAEFDVGDGERIRFRAANVRGKGFAMLAMFFGIAPMYTILEPDNGSRSEHPRGHW
jgi:hypothetical protein